MEVKNNRSIFPVKTFSPSAFHVFTKKYCSYSNSGLNTFLETRSFNTNQSLIYLVPVLRFLCLLTHKLYFRVKRKRDMVFISAEEMGLACLIFV